MSDSLNRAKIMVVDDEPEIIEFLADYLGMSFTVTAASSVTQACAFLAKESFDLILTDLNLPDCRGKSTVSYYRKADFPGAIILLTGQDEFHEEVKRAMADGAQALLKKPFSLKDVEAKIRGHLAQKKSA